jgi:chromosome segregation ATPase
MRERAEEDYVYKNRQLDNYNAGRSTANVEHNFLLRRIIFEVKSLHQTDLDLRELILLLMEKFNSLRADTNFVIQTVEELAKRIKDTESIQEQLNDRLRKGQTDINIIKEILEGLEQKMESKTKEIQGTDNNKKNEKDNIGKS